MSFQDAVIDLVITEARTKPKGWYEANPHEAHVHVPIRRGIQAITVAWGENRTADLRLISGRVATVLKGLTNLHPYENAWDQRARLAAEKAAEAEAAAEEDQDQGTQES